MQEVLRFTRLANLSYKPQPELVHSAENEHSFHPHQSLHCRTCSLHNEASVSSHQVRFVPKMKTQYDLKLDYQIIYVYTL